MAVWMTLVVMLTRYCALGWGVANASEHPANQEVANSSLTIDTALGQNIGETEHPRAYIDIRSPDLHIFMLL